MKRILLMCSCRYYLDVGQELQRRGVEPVVLYVTDHPGWAEDFARAFPNAEVLKAFDLIGARLPENTKARPRPASTADIEALAQHEGATLQLMDRRNYDRVAVHDLRDMYLRYISMWRAVLEAHQPDAVHFHLTPHQGHDFVLYQLCEVMRIPRLILDGTYLKDRIYLRSAIEDVPHPRREEIEAVVALATAPLEEAGQHALAKSLLDRKEIEKTLSRAAQVKQLLNPTTWLGAFRPVRDTAFAINQRRPRELEYRLLEMKGRLVVRQALEIYERASKQVDLDANYVFFPLHYQPERTTLPDGLRFVDQLHLAEVVAAALPPGWNLYVKEHARQFNVAAGLRGVTWPKGRSTGFYQRLISLKNVELVSLDQPSAQLAARAKAVMTITGTSGWEAVQAGIPALVFGNAWFRWCPGVIPVVDTESVAPALADIASGRHRVDRTLVRAFAHVLMSRLTFPGAFSDPLLARSKVSPEENARNIADAIASAAGAPRAVRAAG
jgi:hypothetical protein